MVAVTHNTITVTQTSPMVGAEIGGVDIAAGVSDEQFAEIRQAFSDHGVIFFRDQHLTPEQHIAWAERWGEINVNRFFKAIDGYPSIAEVRKEPDQKRNIGGGWHADHSYDEIPAMGSILYAHEVPPVGGDTLFSSMYAAYDALSDGMKETLATLTADHSNAHVFGARPDAPKDEKDGFANRLGNPEAAVQQAAHPVVIKHPLSGRPSLYVNGGFTTNFTGWTADESAPLLRYLLDHAAKTEFTCRFRWEQGSMAFWDNRSVHHFALNDYQGYRRLMHRITVEGQPLSAWTTAA